MPAKRQGRTGGNATPSSPRDEMLRKMMQKPAPPKRKQKDPAAPAKVIVVGNHKGGVAKTTTTLSIGGNLASKGYRVLLVDLDPQSNLTFSIFREDADYDSVYDSFAKGEPTLPVIDVKENISLVPSSLNLAQLEINLMGLLSREYLLKEKLEPLMLDYDYILIDCQPSMGIFTINALVAADYVLIPVCPDYLPCKNLGYFIIFIDQITRKLNPGLSVLGILVTKFKSNARLHKELVQTLADGYGPLLLETKIRETVKAAEAPMQLSPLGEYAPSSTAARDYAAATEEILRRLENKAAEASKKG